MFVFLSWLTHWRLFWKLPYSVFSMLQYRTSSKSTPLFCSFWPANTRRYISSLSWCTAFWRLFWLLLLCSIFSFAICNSIVWNIWWYLTIEWHSRCLQKLAVYIYISACRCLNVKKKGKKKETKATVNLPLLFVLECFIST